ncbi:MAG TPA: DUF4105 domain-containing protein, partial [Pseudomonadales bacterium]|nr:DUF4105 domain-containing protein [Pseudomonadales bacterium]
MRSLFSVLLALFVINVPLAATAAADTDQEAAAKDPAWYALLHYKSHWLGVKSEVNDEWFFLAENGRTDPLAELRADVQALQSGQLNDDHFACRFPARAAWLVARLGVDKATLPQPKCEALDSYKRAVNAAGVTLVYPVAYLNDPQSMFGHTFILFNQPNETEAVKAKSYTLNYAGKVGEDDSTVKLVADGLFGGYKGV